MGSLLCRLRMGLQKVDMSLPIRWHTSLVPVEVLKVLLLAKLYGQGRS